MDSLGLDPESVDNMEMYNTLPSVLMEKCAALSVRPDTVKNLIQSMQGLWHHFLFPFSWYFHVPSNKVNYFIYFLNQVVLLSSSYLIALKKAQLNIRKV